MCFAPAFSGVTHTLIFLIRYFPSDFSSPAHFFLPSARSAKFYFLVPFFPLFYHPYSISHNDCTSSYSECTVPHKSKDHFPPLPHPVSLFFPHEAVSFNTNSPSSGRLLSNTELLPTLFEHGDRRYSSRQVLLR